MPLNTRRALQGVPGDVVELQVGGQRAKPEVDGVVCRGVDRKGAQVNGLHTRKKGHPYGN